jgi:UDP-N-acetylglucosamine--N-acetylmuramyl-(pentapeptide) pyrophosphoryl-undecaprenol N-acetylglucosamine transferase
MTRLALLAAGGTGGHLFPAEALAAELTARGWIIDLATDERVDRYGLNFPARERHIIAAETFRSKNPIAIVKTALALARGVSQARRAIQRTKPSIVVGFGGYPSFPPLVAAKLTGTPSILHEANAIMGRANRSLSGLVDAVATSWEDTRHVGGAIKAKATHVGMPVRPAVRAAAITPYPEFKGRLKVLVFGGSQGARVFADVAPPAFALLPDALRAKLDVTQQARPEDQARARAAYNAAGITAEVAPFFPDLPARMAASHLVLSRSGGSTVAELGVVGRPAILIPLPGAIDADQLLNARAFEAAGAGVLAQQLDVTPRSLAEILGALLSDHKRLETMASTARSLGKPDAASRLADLVEATASA